MAPPPFSRSDALASMAADSFDLLVIGGGITGAGVALDAAARGLKTALVEANDFASGTSSKSSKLIHGGLRYLQQGEVGLVRQALRERHRLLHNAPHLVHLLPFLVPMFGSGGVLPARISRLLGAAMWGYDAAGGYRTGSLHRRLDREEARELFPSLNDDLVSAYLYQDAEADDARLVLAVLRTAALEYGATVANRVRVTELHHHHGQLTGATVTATELPGTAGQSIHVRARAIVNATGVWSDDIRQLDDTSAAATVRPARGVHITVPRHRLGNTVAAVLPTGADRRNIFVIPHGDQTFIGTTDTEDRGDRDHPRCTAEDVDYLLAAVNSATSAGLTPDEVIGSWAGLRPLVAETSGTGRTADLSRHHRVRTSAGGLITISGGKLTTYRQMAADTVDVVLRNLPESTGSIPRSPTVDLPLRGAEGCDSVVDAAGGYPAVSVEVARHLQSRYGGEARTVFGLIQSDPTLAAPLVDGLPYVAAEAVFAVRYEMAATVDDVLSRRTRARIFGREAAAAAADSVAQLIAPELGWSPAAAAASAAEFRAACEADAADALPASARH